MSRKVPLDMCTWRKFRPRGYFFFFSCSPKLSMKFSLLINMKMPTRVGIFIFISREMFMLSYVKKKELAIVRNLRFISRKKFMLSRVEHETSFITSRPDQPAYLHSLTRMFTGCNFESHGNKDSDQTARCAGRFENSLGALVGRCFLTLRRQSPECSVL